MLTSHLTSLVKKNEMYISICIKICSMSDDHAIKVQGHMREMTKKLIMADQLSIPSDFNIVLDMALQVNPRVLSYHVQGYQDTLGIMLIEHQRALRRTIKPVINNIYDSEDEWVAGNDMNLSWDSWDEK